MQKGQRTSTAVFGGRQFDIVDPAQYCLIRDIRTIRFPMVDVAQRREFCGAIIQCEYLWQRAAISNVINIGYANLSG